MAELTMDNPLLSPSPLSSSPLNSLAKGVQDLKDCIAKLKEDFEDYRIPINDDSQDLHRFCAKLEFLLQAGMKPKTSLLGGKKDYWNFMSECLSSNKSLNDGIKFVKSISELKTNLGRGRALIRFALMHHRLADTIQQCAINGKTLSDWYYPKAVWMQHRTSSDIIGTLYDLNDIQFDLSPQGYDLDTSWPTFAKKTFGAVPPGNWQPPSRSTSIASLQSIPQLEISSSIPASPLRGPDPNLLKLKEELTEAEGKQREALRHAEDAQNELTATEMDAEQLRKKVMDLEDENHVLQRKCNDFEVQCEKMKNELSLKSEIWIEKEAFFRLKQEDAEKNIAQLQERLTQGVPPAAHHPSDMELKVKLMASEKRLQALTLDVLSGKNELEAKTKVDEAKNALVTMQDKRIAQLKRENDVLVERLAAAQKKGENATQSSAVEILAQAGDTDAKVKALVEKLTEQENAYSRILSHNKDLKTMLNSLEDKCRNIATVAKEKVKLYVEENKKLRADMEEMKGSLKDMGGKQEERKDKENAIEKELSVFRESNAKLGDTVKEVNEIIAAKDKEVDRYKVRLCELGKALAAAGFHASEATPDDLLDALNEAEFLSRQLQTGIEGLKEKLGCPPSSDSPDSAKTETETQPETETKSEATTESETKPEATTESEAKPEVVQSSQAESESKPESEAKTESETEPEGQNEAKPKTETGEKAEEVKDPCGEFAGLQIPQAGDGKTKEEALVETKQMVEMMEKIQQEEKSIITSLKQEIEDKKQALEDLRKRKVESEESKKEKEKELQKARDKILDQMKAKREEMTEIRKDISGLRTSVRTHLDDLEAAGSEDFLPLGEGEEEDVDMKAYLQQTQKDIEQILIKFKTKVTSDLSDVSSQRDEASEKILQIQSQLEALQKVGDTEVQESKQKFEEIQNEKQKLQDEVQRSQTISVDLQSDLENVQDELSDLQAVVDDLRGRNETLKAENLELKTSTCTDKQEIAEGQREMEELMNELKSRESRLEEIEEKYEEEKGMKERLQANVEELEKRLLERTAEVTKATREFEETQKLYSDNLDTVSKLEEEDTGLKGRLEKVETEKKAMEEDIKVNSDLIKMFEAQVESHMKTIEDLTEERERLLDEKKVLENKCKENNEDAMTLKEKVTLLQDGLDKEVKVNMVALEVQLERAQENRKAAETERDSTSRELEETSKKLMELTTGHEEMRAGLNLKIDSLRAELERVVTEKNEVSNDRNKLGKNQQNLEEEIERLKETKQKLSAKIDTLEAQCDQTFSQLDTLKAEREALIGKLENVEKAKSELSKERDEYGKKLNDIKSSLGDANAIQDEILKQLDGANAEISERKEQISNLEEQVTKAKEETLEKVKEVDEVKEENEGLKENIDELEKEKLELSEDANKTYFELKEKLGQCECENEALREEIQRVMADKEESFKKWNQENAAFKDQVENLSSGTEKLTEQNSALEEAVAKLQEEKETIVKELEEKESKNVDLVAKLDRFKLELEDSSQRLSGKDEEKEEKLKEIREEMEKLEGEREKQKKELETRAQEVKALEFQLSSQHIQHETQLQSYASQQSELSSHQDKVAEQESLLETLSLELEEAKSDSEVQADRHKREVEDMTDFIHREEAKIVKLREELRQKEEVYKALQDKTHKDMRDLEKQQQGRISELQSKIEQLEQDNELLKKKLIKLARDKDQLWQKNDVLEFKHKVRATDKWMDSALVKTCLGCNAEFSFMLRKHHCRLCGRIFCFNCANNWAMTSYSSKKERVCNSCMMDQSQLEGMSEGEDTDDEDRARAEMEQTVEIPAKLSKKWSQSQDDDGDSDSLEDCPPDGDAVQVVVAPSGAADDSELDQERLLSMTDESKSGRLLEGNSGSDTDTFDVITQDELAESVCDPTPDPSMYSSSLFTEEDLTDNEIESQPDLWVAAGTSYAVPVRIMQPGTTLKWSFTTTPKDINFSLLFRCDKATEDDILIPLCKCNSHKKPVDGELAAHKPGVYTLIFDNKASRFTSKKLHYKIQILPPAKEAEGQ